MSHSERLHIRWVMLGQLNRSDFEDESTSNQPSPTTFSHTFFPNYSGLSCWCGRTAASTGLSIVQGQMLAVPEPTETAWLQGCQILSPCLQWCWISLQPHQGLVKLLVAQTGDLTNHFRQLFLMVSHDSLSDLDRAMFPHPWHSSRFWCSWPNVLRNQP